jgi:hypothetical protein
MMSPSFDLGCDLHDEQVGGCCDIPGKYLLKGAEEKAASSLTRGASLPFTLAARASGSCRNSSFAPLLYQGYALPGRLPATIR